jgi:hypothetical protein
MNMSAIWVRSLLAPIVALSALAVARAQTAEQIITKARAYLGDEAALNAVKSVHFVGQMESRQLGPDAPKPLEFAIDIIFQLPYRQRIVKTGPDGIETVVLDDFDAWQRLDGRGTKTGWQVTLFDVNSIRRFRANTWENLHFFRGIEARGGRVEVVGPATVDGVATIKVAFIHDSGIVFYRYIDKATGKLVLTDTDRGDRITEEGEIMVNGIRFPRRVITVGKSSDGKGKIVDVKVVITFDKVTLNETFPASLFGMPEVTPQTTPPTAAAP